MADDVAVPAVAIGPAPDPLLEDAVRRGGARLSPFESADALVWTAGPIGFPDPLPDNIRWVQLDSAGVEQWFDAKLITPDTQIMWTSAAGAFAATVAEHALTLLLAGVRALPEHMAARTWRQHDFYSKVGTLRGATVAMVGAGGIGRALIPMLASLGADVIAVNRSGSPVPGAIETLPTTRLNEVWPRADHFVIGAPATSATHHLVSGAELAQMKSTSWVINVARGSLIDTDALVHALRNGSIGGAGLDVTDPEPLPDGHPLWELPNVIITPHDSNPPSVRPPAFADHVALNVTRFVAGERLTALIDPVVGY
ncbi:D-isomer specific 2-hydroxyacid dehydrogenase family protein [Rhodococcus sp. WAY2]|uniref:D-isomer specific 2-hydroxyacid dehydrogenase family protein n=1 Tax=Rhodococcus sp. WAY2 TaxID=2663121 RepID=UPI00131FCA43|nr:D-isomer specific 2-hydroxyacid dehydrogenase family protein [Rhodococcus sp. WAY2]QHE68891.1 D-3-phosphoglycerate dehydrogenase [Rhodococcus sp. WAY2]